ncbi:MAG: glucose-1-phosphate thymidylyltransferase [Bacteroidales bacterium]|jgi:UDP-N-acetylglucosamine diphosphorylase/glucosamine-1-phosphate N-acetyltransferase|nr:glucose-1-phosphate thymidylyltransferase [Bacteroidales bacterium]
MENVVLFDGGNAVALQPFTFTRPVGDIRVGILTIAEKWTLHLNAHISYLTEPYLQAKYPFENREGNCFIDASLLPTPHLVQAIRNLKEGEALCEAGKSIAFRVRKQEGQTENSPRMEIPYTQSLHRLQHHYDIFRLNGQELASDFELLCTYRKSAPLSASNRLIGNPAHLFIEEGATIEASTLNCQTGYIYIGKESEIMENCAIRGPFALCNHAMLKMGSNVYGATTVGPHCKVGGELSNVVFFGYSNKAHDGFLGNSVIGEWCNLGADTNASNLKNNYASIRIWDYEKQTFADTGLQFSGLLMGDHTKCGISTMFNSGTVTGVGCNLFGHGYHRNFIPSFSYGHAQTGYDRYRIDKIVETARVVFARRNKNFDAIEEEILRHLFTL